MNWICLTCVGRLQLINWNLFYWYWTGWLLRTINVSSLFLCLSKNLCLTQYPSPVWLALLTEGSCALDTDVIKRLRCWEVEILTMVYCWGLAKSGSFHFYFPQKISWYRDGATSIYILDQIYIGLVMCYDCKVLMFQWSWDGYVP